MYKHKPLNRQSGAVSMITVLFVTVIFMVLVLGFIRIMISEQRQATDDDLSNRAYFAAESGVEDAKTFLAEYMLEGGNVSESDLDKFDECEPFGDPALIDDDSLRTEITCQLVDTELPYALARNAPAWHSFVWPLRSNDEYNRFELSWHHPEFDGPAGIMRSNVDLPTPSGWGSPAAMKLTLISRPHTNAPVSVNDHIDEEVRVVHMLPSNSGTNSFDVTSSNFGISDGDEPVPVHCDPGAGTGDYVCNVEFTGLNNTNRRYFVALTPLYTSTSVRLGLFDGADVVNMVDVQAKIDVTARAGDIFRRVEARILLEPSLLPDLALGANEICKDYSLREDAEEGDGGSFDEVNPGIGDNFCVHM